MKKEKKNENSDPPCPLLKSFLLAFFFVSVLFTSLRRLRFYIVIILYGRTFYFPNDLAILTVPLNPFHFLQLFFFFLLLFCASFVLTIMCSLVCTVRFPVQPCPPFMTIWWKLWKMLFTKISHDLVMNFVRISSLYSYLQCQTHRVFPKIYPLHSL